MSDAHCIVEGEECILPDNVCASTDPQCDGEHTLVVPDGSEISCLPFRCGEDDQCFTACTSSVQCANGFVCDADGVCIERPRFTAPGFEFACHAAGQPGRRDPLSWWLALVALALTRLRRRTMGPHDAR